MFWSYLIISFLEHVSYLLEKEIAFLNDTFRVLKNIQKHKY